MAATPSIDVSGWLHEQLAQASPDLLRAMVTAFAEALMSAEAEAVCGAGYGERSDERRNTRNGYRRREWDTRAGSIELAIPKLRQGSYFPDWLLERRRRAEAALVTVVATSYLLGVSTRRMEKLVGALGRHCCVGRSRMAGDWSGDCTSDELGLCWLPVPAGGDHGRGPLVLAVWPVLSRR
jgi:transposase-like protein